MAKTKAKKINAKAKTKAKPKNTKKAKTQSKPKAKSIAIVRGDADADVKVYYYEPKSEYEQTQNLSEELKDAWLKLKNFALSLGEQRFYTSPKAMMFARKTCYMFVRPKKSYLELVFFMREQQSDPLVTKTELRAKRYEHTVKLVHEDQIESPLTDWIQEAFAETHV